MACEALTCATATDETFLSLSCEKTDSIESIALSIDCDPANFTTNQTSVCDLTSVKEERSRSDPTPQVSEELKRHFDKKVTRSSTMSNLAAATERRRGAKWSAWRFSGTASNLLGHSKQSSRAQQEADPFEPASLGPDVDLGKLAKQGTFQRLLSFAGDFSEDPNAGHPLLMDWRKYRVLPCLRAATLLSRGAFLRATLLRGLAVVLQLVVLGSIVTLYPPSAPESLAVAAWVLLQFAWQGFAFIDVFFNLVEYRSAAQQALRHIRSALCFNARPSSFWRWVEERLFKGRGAFVPKSPDRLLSDFFHGFPANTFFVSYCWAPHGESELPRRVAQRYIPEQAPKTPNKAWLDVEQLIPGTPQVQAMISAVKTARFRIVFLSRAYLRSVNCLKEFNALRGEPGRTLFLVYTTQRNKLGEPLAPPGNLVLQLLEEGHKVHLLREGEEFDQSALLRTLIRTGAMATLLAERSPRINAQWHATAAALCLPRSYRRVVLRFGHLALQPVVLWLGLMALLNQLARGDATPSGTELREHLLVDSLVQGDAAACPELPRAAWPPVLTLLGVSLVFDAIFLLQVLLVLPIIVMPSSSELDAVPDVGLLLLILVKLGLARRVKVFNCADPSLRSDDSKLSRLLRVLQKHGVIEPIDDDEDGAGLKAAMEAQTPRASCVCSRRSSRDDAERERERERERVREPPAGRGGGGGDGEGPRPSPGCMARAARFASPPP